VNVRLVLKITWPPRKLSKRGGSWSAIFANNGFEPAPPAETWANRPARTRVGGSGCVGAGGAVGGFGEVAEVVDVRERA
jgi:hypothetical protein